jgi:tight adherence protein B
MIMLVQPTYFDAVKETPAFIPAALIVATFLVINVIFMKMMVNIKV